MGKLTQQQMRAAQKIQSVSRGRACRRHQKKRHNAASCIQRHARGRRGRMSAKERHALRKAEMERIKRRSSDEEKIKNATTKNDTTLSDEAEAKRKLWKKRYAIAEPRNSKIRRECMVCKNGKEQRQSD